MNTSKICECCLQEVEEGVELKRRYIAVKVKTLDICPKCAKKHVTYDPKELKPSLGDIVHHQ